MKGFVVVLVVEELDGLRMRHETAARVARDYDVDEASDLEVELLAAAQEAAAQLVVDAAVPH